MPIPPLPPAYSPTTYDDPAHWINLVNGLMLNIPTDPGPVTIRARRCEKQSPNICLIYTRFLALILPI